MGLKAKLKKARQQNKKLAEENKFLRKRILELNRFDRFDIMDLERDIEEESTCKR